MAEFFEVSEIIPPFRLLLFFYLILISNEIGKVSVSNILVYSIADKDVLIPILVHIKDQSSPTPIRRLYSGEICNLFKCSITPIQVKAILYKLEEITRPWTWYPRCHSSNLVAALILLLEAGNMSVENISRCPSLFTSAMSEPILDTEV